MLKLIKADVFNFYKSILEFLKFYQYLAVSFSSLRLLTKNKVLKSSDAKCIAHFTKVLKIIYLKVVLLNFQTEKHLYEKKVGK